MKKLSFLIFLVVAIIAKDSLLTDNQIVGRINKVNGDATEFVMNNIFKNNNYIKLEGEIDGRGIDGLFVKKNAFGVIEDVNIVEAKYNSSQLTQSTRQMSKEWMERKLDKLIAKYPNNNDYKSIKKHVVNDNFKATVFGLKNKKDGIEILFDTVKEVDSKVVRTNFKTISIDKSSPKNSFEMSIVDNFKKGKTQAFRRVFPHLNFAKASMLSSFNLDTINLKDVIKSDLLSKVKQTSPYQYKSNAPTKVSHKKYNNVKIKASNFYKVIKTIKKIKIR